MINTHQIQHIGTLFTAFHVSKKENYSLIISFLAVACQVHSNKQVSD